MVLHTYFSLPEGNNHEPPLTTITLTTINQQHKNSTWSYHHRPNPGIHRFLSQSCSLPQGCARRTFPKPLSVTWSSNSRADSPLTCRKAGECIYMRIYYIHIHLADKLSICLSESMCLPTCMDLYIYPSICLPIYVSMYMYPCIYVSMYRCMHACMHAA